MTEAPKGSVGHVPAIAPRGRRSRWLTAMTVFLAGSGALSLILGSVSILVDGSVPTTTGGGILDAPAHRVEYSDAPSVSYVAYDHGEDASYSIELVNDGPLPVTVEAVPLDGLRHERRLFAPTAVFVAPEGASEVEPDAVAPFEPFRLWPGDSRILVVAGEFANCAYFTERAIDLIVEQPVTWSVLGRSRTDMVALSDQLAIRSPFMRECPGRVMDRSARTRTGAEG